MLQYSTYSYSRTRTSEKVFEIGKRQKAALTNITRTLASLRAQRVALLYCIAARRATRRRVSSMFHHNYHHVVETPPITPLVPRNANDNNPASANGSRSFADYRYAIEAGLISPHHVRCYTPPWEQRSPTTAAEVVSSRFRAGKRYHTPSSDDDDQENSNADQMMMCDDHRAAAVR